MISSSPIRIIHSFLSWFSSLNGIEYLLPSMYSSSSPKPLPPSFDSSCIYLNFFHVFHSLTFFQVRTRRYAISPRITRPNWPVAGFQRLQRRRGRGNSSLLLSPDCSFSIQQTSPQFFYLISLFIVCLFFFSFLLPLCWLSLRAGRTGRVRPGTVYRVYSKDLYGRFDEHDASEVLRWVLLDMILYGHDMDMIWYDMITIFTLSHYLSVSICLSLSLSLSLSVFLSLFLSLCVSLSHTHFSQ